MLPCPRRAEASFSITPPDRDHWREDDKSCSYCGSMHPDTFMRLAAAGNKVTPTDKGYKVYVEVDNALVGKRACVTSASHPIAGYKILTEEMADTVTWERESDRKYYVGRYVQFSEHPATKTKKFYFMHLSEEQKVEFVGLINDKKLTLAHPGYFYVLPYFVTRKPATES